MRPIYQTTKGGDYALDSHKVVEAPTHVELHLSTDTSLPKRFGKKIKAAGGGYSNCRRRGSHRYVTLPLRDDTRDLINDLLRQYGRTGGKGTTVIARGPRIEGSQAWMSVHTAPHVGEHDSPLRHWEERHWRALENAVERGLCNLHFGTPPVPTLAEREGVATMRLDRARCRVRDLEEELEEARRSFRRAKSKMTAIRREIEAADAAEEQEAC